MTQYVAVEAATDRILQGIGRPDPPGYTGPPTWRPFPKNGIVYYPWQGPLALSDAPTPTSVYEWHDAPVWIEKAHLANAKAAAWDRIKKARDKAEAGTFLFNGDLYDANKENISGAALAAMMAKLSNQPFSIAWTLADNTVKVLDGDAMQALGLAMVAYIDSLHNTARSLRNQIEAAATPQQAYAIAWPGEEMIAAEGESS